MEKQYFVNEQTNFYEDEDYKIVVNHQESYITNKFEIVVECKDMKSTTKIIEGIINAIHSNK